jgi:hypothetical protein
MLVAAVVLGLLLPTTTARAATPSPKPPADCVLAPGRVGVLPIVGGHHAVMVTSLSFTCTTQYGIREGVTLNRYWVSSRTWTAERKRKVPDVGNVVGSINGWNAPFYCNVAGALMSVTVTYKFFDPVTTKLVSNVTYFGRTTALCPV